MEQRRGVCREQRPELEAVLAVHTDPAPTGGEHGQVAGRGEQARSESTEPVGQVLGVVEHEQQRSPPAGVDKAVLDRGERGCADRGGDGVGQVFGRDPGEVDEPAGRARTAEVMGGLDGEAGFADTAGADDGHPPVLLDGGEEAICLVRASDEARNRVGELTTSTRRGCLLQAEHCPLRGRERDRGFEPGRRQVGPSSLHRSERVGLSPSGAEGPDQEHVSSFVEWVCGDERLAGRDRP